MKKIARLLGFVSLSKTTLSKPRPPVQSLRFISIAEASIIPQHMLPLFFSTIKQSSSSSLISIIFSGNLPLLLLLLLIVSSLLLSSIAVVMISDNVIGVDVDGGKFRFVIVFVLVFVVLLLV